MNRPIRVAIVGAGPAGIYAGSILANRVPGVAIDLFESLPAPYGLIRYGVAPDHPRIKGIVTSLHEMLDGGAIRFIGNVEVGADVSVADLRAYYHAVIFATGAIRDADLDIPGVELAGSYGAADFVSWYDGHPDVPRDWTLDAAQVAVIGNGNVALDVARILAKHPKDLLTTEIPDNVVAGLTDSAVTDVHVFGRRGPGDVKFTPIELRELGELRDVDIILDDADFAEDTVAAPAEGVKPTNQSKVIARIFASWREREVGAASRRLHLHFFHKPLDIIGDQRVEALRFERTVVDADGRVTGTGIVHEYPVAAVYRAVGYYGSPVNDVPFAPATGTIPNDGGRVLDADGTRAPGLYATGWIKRGPVGLIGHTKSDATETIENLVEDLDTLVATSEPSADDILGLLESRGVPFTTWDGWLRLDAHERFLGSTTLLDVERERVKVVPRDEQVAISRDEALALS
ncbi:FAD-dependent oxidoreductase [Diaminobutyricibacter sp. McL0618]|uniref:FAD-dependent oxidoreductase n=1 Tax=Leifsonia sp. McL0618 TaxID=3415677 RepID=UPI003CFB929C